MDDTTETPAETPEPVTPDDPSGEAAESESADDTTETPAEVAPLVEITLPRRMNVVLTGVRFRFGTARARLTPLQRLYLTRRGARFEEIPEEPPAPDDDEEQAAIDARNQAEDAAEQAAGLRDENSDPATPDAVDETTQPEEPLVPDESWTDEALDALGKERGITWRSNASKATKVAKLTEG
ncbi:hypothetical protein ACTJJ4_07650 [Microbacterium sp. 22195]|uniref:hypothetical protein n=1 Tax=Microbacterium sp. 22195 TaxID=3453891 RepID=UPI003F871D13